MRREDREERDMREERAARGREALGVALQAWRCGAEMRERRRRYRDYTYGRQWQDLEDIGDGRPMTEGEIAKSSGARPMTNNMIRQLVKCVTGNFRQRLHGRPLGPGEIDREDYDSDGSTAETHLPAEIAERNEIDELDSRMLEEFLISGCAIQRIVTERRMEGEGVWIDNVSPERFFVNRFNDPRGHDIEVIGMLHDYSLRETMMRFGCGRTARASEIERIYSRVGNVGVEPSIGDSTGSSFFHAPSGRCRVIEVWTLESRSVVMCHDPLTTKVFMTPVESSGAIEELNGRRRRAGKEAVKAERRLTARWHCRMLAPTGEVLDEYDSPYEHGMHPFALKFYPLTDGEVHSFVEDVIDQQRYINRLITLIDHIMSVSAKGVLVYPLECKPDDWDEQRIIDEWTRPGGVFPIRSTANGQEPHQVSTRSGNTDAYHLLDLEMKLMQQISGVSGALQGRMETSNGSAALYDAQVRNSAIAILDLLESFNAFRRGRNEKCMMV